MISKQWKYVIVQLLMHAHIYREIISYSQGVVITVCIFSVYGLTEHVIILDYQE
jgi:hypothetical protein